MKTEHLSDSIIQEYVLGNAQEISVTQHLHQCADCKTKVAVYQQIITGIVALPSAEFDFNVLEGVKSRIAKRSFKYSYAHLFWLFSILGTGAIIATGYWFGKYVAHLFSGAADMSVYLALTIAIGPFLMSGIEMAKKYKKQLDSINFT